MKALELSRKVGDRVFEGVLLGTRGSAYRRLGHSEKAEQCIHQALEISREFADRRVEGRALGRLARHYEDEKDYEKALKYLTDQLEIYRSLEDRSISGEAITIAGIGQAHNFIGNKEEAKDNLLEALKLSQELGNKRNAGT